MTSPIQHTLSVEDLAYRLADRIRATEKNWAARLQVADLHTDKMPTVREQDQHEARIGGYLVALSILLYGNAVRVEEARTFVTESSKRRQSTARPVQGLIQ